MKDRFLNYLHYFRGFAILLIVGVHCRTSIPWAEDSFMHDVLFYALDFSTILFVFISGFLFQYLHEQKFEYYPYLLKKLKHVVIPYIIVSVPALVDKVFIEKDAAWMTDFYKSLNIPLQFVYLLLTGKQSGPFYFIPMICLFFIMAPLFQAVQKSTYFSWITLVIVFIGMFSYNYAYYATIWESLVYFIPVYLFGMWASKYRSVTIGINNYVLGLLCAVYLTIFCLEMADVIYIYRLKTFGEPHYFFPDFNWGKLKVMCLAIILLNVFYRLRKYEFPTLVTLGNFSFGIYFVHIYFINVTELTIRYIQSPIKQNALIFLVYTAAVIAASMITIYGVKKIFGKNSRLIIGS
ncbi:MAG: hypothetical protein DI539_24715 [Flavobacterium psychrophilum]|nr:MAG: hypothetical protein DI539_24715 [Flavobacterium psychrophilum]